MKILLGALIGGCVGFGLNYMCKVTGGTCPIWNNHIVSILLAATLGAIVGAGLMLK